MAHHLEMKLSNFVGWRAEKSLKMTVFEGLRAGAVRVFSRGSPGTKSIAITESGMNLVVVLTLQINQNNIHP